MNGFASLLWRPWFHTLLLFSPLAYLAGRDLWLQYSSSDTLIYTLVGEAIYRDGILPYNLVFDHKPFLTYLLYGPLAFIDIRWNVFVLFSVIWMIILAWIVYALLLKRSLPLLVVLFVMVVSTLGNVAFSGNTGIVYVPLELLAVGLALGSNGRPAWFALSAAAAVAAINVNYVAAIPLLPALLYSLYVSSSTLGWFSLRALTYLALSLAILSAALGLLAWAGTDLRAYFTLQQEFLSGYSGGREVPQLAFLVIVAGTTILLLLFLLRIFAPQSHFKPLCIAMALLVNFSFLSFVMSGKYYYYYAFMITAPTAVMFLTLDYSRAWLRAFLCFFMIGGALSFVFLGMFFYLRDPGAKPDLRQVYAPLTEAVGSQPLMSMHASVVPLYFSNLHPFQPLVWHDHAEIIYGTGADKYYVDHLARRPSFVMTANDWCEGGGAAWTACDILKARYNKLQSQPSMWPIHSYSLYQLK